MHVFECLSVCACACVRACVCLRVYVNVFMINLGNIYLLYCIYPNSVTDVILLFSPVLTYKHSHVRSNDFHIHLNMNAHRLSLSNTHFLPLYALLFTLLLFPSRLHSSVFLYPTLLYLFITSPSLFCPLISPPSTPLILTYPHVQTYAYLRVLTGAGWNQITDPVTFIPFWYNDDTGEANYARPKIIEER